MTADDTRTAARAAYRLGLLDLMLHEDVIGRLEVPGVFQRSLTGERQARIDELARLGITMEDLKDLMLSSDA